MVSGISALSTNSISLLYGTNNTTSVAEPANAAQKLLSDATGNSDDVFKAGNAIGKIIEIVSGMKTSDAKASIGMFTMDGATRTDGQDGEWSMTKTGTGTVRQEDELRMSDTEIMQQQAAGSGPEAERAKAYLKAVSSGSMEFIDLSTKGVSATMTQTNYYNADGSDKGQKNSWNVTGLDEFLKANTHIADDGTLRDNATGKYAGIEQNGTKFSYAIY